MSKNCCVRLCSALGIFFSVIVAIIGGFLTFNATITVTPAFLWVLFGIAVVYQAVILLKTGCTNTNHCICSNLTVVFTGILGTIFTSLILLGITFAATSVLGAIITGLLLGFFTLLITSVICLIKCIANCD